MQPESKRARHSQLVLKMADKQDIDLAELIMRASVSFDEMEEAVDKCLSCTHPAECSRLLETDTKTISLPEYCRNGDLFDRLNSQ